MRLALQDNDRPQEFYCKDVGGPNPDLGRQTLFSDTPILISVSVICFAKSLLDIGRLPPKTSEGGDRKNRPL